MSRAIFILDRYLTITLYNKTHFNIFLLKLSLFTMQFHMCRLLQNHFMSGVQVHKHESNLNYLIYLFFQRNEIILLQYVYSDWPIIRSIKRGYNNLNRHKNIRIGQAFNLKAQMTPYLHFVCLSVQL